MAHKYSTPLHLYFWEDLIWDMVKGSFCKEVELC